MRRRGPSFAIGLFVIVGVVLGIFALGWFGGGRRLIRPYTTYIAFFTDSVHGLYPSSAVSYQGIDVGHVKAVDVAPDPAYVMVTMEVFRPELVTPRTYARIDTTGLAGAAYVNLAEAPPSEALDPPQYDFPIHYPVIATRPSQLSDILSATQAVVDEIRGSDVAGLIREANRTVQAAGDVLGGSQTREILTSLQAATERLTRTLATLDTAVSQGHLETAARRAIEDLDAQTRVLGARANAALANLNQASDALNRLLERLYQRPADLFLSQPQPARGGTR